MQKWLASKSYRLSLVHFRFLTSKKVALKDAGAANTVGPHSHEEQRENETKRAEDPAGAEVTLALEFVLA